MEKGRNAVLVCEATGEPAPVISWVRDTVPINLEVCNQWPNLKNLSGGLNLSRGLNMVGST